MLRASVANVATQVKRYVISSITSVIKSPYRQDVYPQSVSQVRAARGKTSAHITEHLHLPLSKSLATIVSHHPSQLPHRKLHKLRSPRPLLIRVIEHQAIHPPQHILQPKLKLSSLPSQPPRHRTSPATAQQPAKSIRRMV